MATTVQTYTNSNYGGRRLEVAADLPRLPAGVTGAVSSVRTTTPVALFSRSAFKGDALVVTEDAPSLRSIRGRNFDNRARSALAVPVTIRLNVIVGAKGADPARAFDLINRDIDEANLRFGPYGIRVDADRLRVGGPLLHTPHTIETFEAERAPMRSPDHLNVTYFNGSLHRAVAWRWRVRSVRVSARTGSPSATLYDQPRQTGAALRVTGQLTSVPDSHRNQVFSFALSKHSEITLYSEPNFGGQARTFHNAVDDLSTSFGYFDWWRSTTARTTGNRNNWADFDIWLQPGASTTSLAWGVGRALGQQIGSTVTHQQAEAALKHIFAGNDIQRAIRIG